MLISLRSLWEQAGQTIQPAGIGSGELITGTAQPITGDVGQQVTISLFTQNVLLTATPTTAPNNPPGINPQDLATSPYCVIKAPDNSLFYFGTGALNPVITHTAGTGVYSFVMNPYKQGLWRYTWYVGSEPVFSGEFYVRAVPAP